ncbi:MAG: hypothetical protein EBZ48_04750 [Proteobacteria bacterium]|nr:hypothetical protein [Pseudomonadota bacterium]
MHHRGAAIHLADADPAVSPYWRKFSRYAMQHGAQVHPLHIEITGRLQRWEEAVHRALGGKRHLTASDVAAVLDSLANLPRAVCPLPLCEVAISLNLLSQIPIYWRERILRLIRRYAPDLVASDDRNPEQITASLDRLCQLLQTEHLRDLARLGTRLAILITDEEFYYYHWDRSNWQVEQALYGVDLNSLPGHPLLLDSWLWHIAPQGVEEAEYGAMHKVKAVAFTCTVGHASSDTR